MLEEVTSDTLTKEGEVDEADKKCVSYVNGFHVDRFKGTLIET